MDFLRGQLESEAGDLSADQRTLFSGYHELGGDNATYDEAATWYDNCQLKVEAISAAIVILDKPTTYLFGGMSNSDKKKLNEKIGAVVSKLEDLKSSVNQADYDNRMRNIDEHINSEPEITFQNDILTVVPTRTNVFGIGLCRSLAYYAASDVTNFSDAQKKKMRDVRCWWMREFRTVNVSRMKRAALMYLEMCPYNSMIKIARKWVDNHGGKPSEMSSYGKNAETENILKADVTKFLEERRYWIRHASKFNVRHMSDPAAPLATGEPAGLTRFGDELGAEFLEAGINLSAELAAVRATFTP